MAAWTCFLWRHSLCLPGNSHLSNFYMTPIYTTFLAKMFTALAAIFRGGMSMYSIEATLDCSLYNVQSTPQSKQSTRLFLQPSELGPSHLFSRRQVCPPFGFWGGGGAHSLAGEGVPIRTRGQTLWYAMYICTFTFSTHLQIHCLPQHILPLPSSVSRLLISPF